MDGLKEQKEHFENLRNAIDEVIRLGSYKGSEPPCGMTVLREWRNNIDDEIKTLHFRMRTSS